jgi:predicted ATPase
LLCRADVQLLTLTGPPGIGKTRLSIAAASELTEQFTDGVIFIPLATITEPNQVIATIAQLLGVTESAKQSTFEALLSFVQTRHILLILDNCEQVVQVGPLLAELLSAAPNLTLLATSRVALRLRSEHRFIVPALALPSTNPDESSIDLPQILSSYAAIALFVQRAQAVMPHFTLTTTNAAAIAEICTRLDGLPLAIELAAARIALFTPSELRARLTSRLGLLTGGALDLPARQQTLRHAIRWSYELLEPAEQRLFQRLGVFVGSFTLTAVEQICTAAGDLGENVVEHMVALIDKSLVRSLPSTHIAEQSRFDLLETIREYALEQLLATGMHEEFQQRQARYYLALATQAEPYNYQYGAQQQSWKPLLERELHNLRAVLAWCVNGGNSSIGLELAGRLGWFWVEYTYWREGRHWLETTYAQVSDSERYVHLKALIWCYLLVVEGLNEYTAAPTILAHSANLALQLDEKLSYAVVLKQQGMFKRRIGEYAAAAELLSQAIAQFLVLDDTWNCADARMHLGDSYRDQCDYRQATFNYEQSMAGYRAANDLRGYAWIHIKLGEIARDQGLFDQSRRWCEQALTLFSELDNASGINWATISLAISDLEQGQLVYANERFRATLQRMRHSGHAVGIAYCLKGLADVLVQRGTHEGIAVELFSAAERMLSSIGAGITPCDRIETDRYLAMLQARMEPTAWEVAWSAGQLRTPEQAITLALQPDKDTVEGSVPQPASH